MKRVLVLLLFTVVFVQFAFAQQTSEDDSIATLKPRQLAFYYTKHLSSGALLVSLQARAKGIETLQRAGDYESASKIIKQQLIQNKIIVRGFMRAFNYCPVYFYYNTDDDSVSTGHMNGIFLDTNLVVNPSIKLRESFFLIAKEGDTEMRNGGILVMDSHFNLLGSPFPYFTEYASFNKFWRAVERLNEKLNDFYPYKQR